MNSRAFRGLQAHACANGPAPANSVYWCCDAGMYALGVTSGRGCAGQRVPAAARPAVRCPDRRRRVPEGVRRGGAERGPTGAGERGESGVGLEGNRERDIWMRGPRGPEGRNNRPHGGGIAGDRAYRPISLAVVSGGRGRGLRLRAARRVGGGGVVAGVEARLVAGVVERVGSVLGRPAISRPICPDSRGIRGVSPPDLPVRIGACPGRLCGVYGRGLLGSDRPG